MDATTIQEAGDWLVHRWSLSELPTPWAVAGVAAALVVALAWRPAWRVLRHAATLVHEMGHVLVAWLTGRRVRGIRLHSDASGLTFSAGRPQGLGVLLTVLAGYPAPALVGLGLVAAAVSGYAGAGLTATMVLLVLALLLIRNVFGLLVTVGALAAAGAVFWQAAPMLATLFTLAVGLLLVFSAARAALGLWAVKGTGSDPDLAARHSVLPAPVWIVLFQAIALAAAVLAVVLAVGAAL